jgi:hypothetical protein
MSYTRKDRVRYPKVVGQVIVLHRVLSKLRKLAQVTVPRSIADGGLCEMGAGRYSVNPHEQVKKEAIAAIGSEN